MSATRPNLRTPLALAILLLATAGAVRAGGLSLARTADHDYDPPAPGAYTLPVIKAAADGDVLDARGTSLRLGELTRGRITVLSFIYTRCASARACPYATGVLRELHAASAQNAALARRMRLVSLSFDPANDTPERMAAYAAMASDRPNASPWHFLTTASQTELAPILEAYGQAVDRKENPRDPAGPLNHTLRVYLVDRQGRIRNIYSSGTLDARLILSDVETLALEPAPAGGAMPTPTPSGSNSPISPEPR